MNEDPKKDWVWALEFLRSILDGKGQPEWTYVRIAGAIGGSEKSVRRWCQQNVQPMPIHRQSLARLGQRVEREHTGKTATPIAV